MVVFGPMDRTKEIEAEPIFITCLVSGRNSHCTLFGIDSTRRAPSQRSSGVRLLHRQIRRHALVNVSSDKAVVTAKFCATTNCTLRSGSLSIFTIFPTLPAKRGDLALPASTVMTVDGPNRVV